MPPPATSNAPTRWSRRYLAGNTALIAAHQNLNGLDVSLSPDARMVAANERYLLFPIAGPGGKLGVHPTAKTGRLPTVIPTLACSSKLVDFAFDPFNPSRVASLHEDSALRIWILPENGDALPENGIDQPQLTIEGKHAGKLSALAFHPTANDLIAACSSESGGSVILWNVAKPDDSKVLPIEGEGATSLAWSPDGSKLLLSCKDKAVRLFSFTQLATAASTPDDATTENMAKAFLASSLPRMTHPSRPHVTLTFAQSSDGKIAGEGKKQLALSCSESMLMTHQLRTLHDGILVGIGTVLNDNPQLNARLLSHPPAVADLPRPIVLDSSLRTPVDCKLIKNFAAGTGRKPLILCSKDADASSKSQLESAGSEVVQVASDSEGHLSWSSVLETLASLGVQRLMVEGGAAVIDSLMKERQFIDALLVTIAPRIVGPDGYGFSAKVPSQLNGSGGDRGDELDDLHEICGRRKFGSDDVIIWQQKAQANPGGPRTTSQSNEANHTQTELKFHDLRNAKLAWLDDEHCVAVGHGIGSTRQLRLLHATAGAIEEKAKLSLDVSPAALNPRWDPDTDILWLWSKGERSVLAYEIQVRAKEPFTSLAPFQHQQPQLGIAFLEKAAVDPKKVEVAVGYRLEKTEIRRVSWTIPRLRVSTIGSNPGSIVCLLE